MVPSQSQTKTGTVPCGTPSSSDQSTNRPRYAAIAVVRAQVRVRGGAGRSGGRATSGDPRSMKWSLGGSPAPIGRVVQTGRSHPTQGHEGAAALRVPREVLEAPRDLRVALPGAAHREGPVVGREQL